LDVPLELYKETQRIEADGGMMIKVTKYLTLFTDTIYIYLCLYSMTE